LTVATNIFQDLQTAYEYHAVFLSKNFYSSFVTVYLFKSNSNASMTKFYSWTNMILAL